MPGSLSSTRRVQFRDTDAAGIAHFSSFFPMMEEVEHEFWRTLGLSVVMRDGEGHLAWPRVSASCDYHRPIRFEDVLEITMTIGRIGEKSVTFDFAFTHAGAKIATGRLVAVCCRVDAGGTPRSIVIPSAIAKQLRDFQASGG